MKNNQSPIIPEPKNLDLPLRPKSLRPAPSLSGNKSLKPKTLVVRPIKVKSPVVG